MYKKKKTSQRAEGTSVGKSMKWLLYNFERVKNPFRYGSLKKDGFQKYKTGIDTS